MSAIEPISDYGQFQQAISRSGLTVILYYKNCRICLVFRRVFEAVASSDSDAFNHAKFGSIDCTGEPQPLYCAREMIDSPGCPAIGVFCGGRLLTYIIGNMDLRTFKTWLSDCVSLCLREVSPEQAAKSKKVMSIMRSMRLGKQPVIIRVVDSHHLERLTHQHKHIVLGWYTSKVPAASADVWSAVGSLALKPEFSHVRYAFWDCRNVPSVAAASHLRYRTECAYSYRGKAISLWRSRTMESIGNFTQWIEDCLFATALIDSAQIPGDTTPVVTPPSDVVEPQATEDPTDFESLQVITDDTRWHEVLSAHEWVGVILIDNFYPLSVAMGVIVNVLAASDAFERVKFCMIGCIEDAPQSIRYHEPRPGHLLLSSRNLTKPLVCESSSRLDLETFIQDAIRKNLRDMPKISRSNCNTSCGCCCSSRTSDPEQREQRCCSRLDFAQEAPAGLHREAENGDRSYSSLDTLTDSLLQSGPVPCSGEHQDRPPHWLRLLLGRKPFLDREPGCRFEASGQVGRANEGSSYFNVTVSRTPEDVQTGTLTFGVGFGPDVTLQARFVSAELCVKFRYYKEDQLTTLKITDLFPKDLRDDKTTMHVKHRAMNNVKAKVGYGHLGVAGGATRQSGVRYKHESFSQVCGRGVDTDTAKWTFAENQDKSIRRGLGPQYKLSVTLRKPAQTNVVHMEIWGKAVLEQPRLTPLGASTATLKLGTCQKPYQRIVDPGIGGVSY